VNAKPYADDPAVDADIPAKQRRSLMDLDAAACHWPVGDPARRNFFFCGAVRMRGKPYCAAHWARAVHRTPPSQGGANRRKST
jgi:hypothetical protein